MEELQNVVDTTDQYVSLNNYYRKLNISKIPKVSLSGESIKNTKLITNRKELLRLMCKDGVVAELGVANGEYTSSILNINRPKKLHLIDIWQSERYGENLYINVCEKFKNEQIKGQLEIHRKLSTEAVNDFPDKYFDWIYIDTTHCYNNTKSELELYASKIKDDGVIAGHDYSMGNWGEQLKYGVIEAVHEFCEEFDWRIKYITMDLAESQSFVICRK
ncbi:hypothetical protein HR45_15495 [Shewanella mangrovi]|uniref:Methyltransferase n=1 Tax=Shewanella mangrovi TaxID=1515746 RepID=A0A094LN29_9GAMM|nr:hypothetical protein HR45_15495 [Shewanella mangrovi]